MKTNLSKFGGLTLILVLAVAGIWWLTSKSDPVGGLKSTISTPSTGQFVSRRAEFAGSQSCRECHETHFDNYTQTSHYHTSSAPEEGLVKGHFSGERATYEVNAGFRMVLTREDGKFRQHIQSTEYAPFHQDIDVVIGAGVYAQSSAGWEGSKLVRLQAHYLTPADHWTLNPGTDPVPTRLLVSNRCLECHATYFEPDPSVTPAFNENHRSIHHNQDNFMLKMHCEKCHGPAQAHVDYFKNPQPNVDFTKLIVNPAKLDRERQIQVCGLCHSGVGELLAPSFTYQPGDDLTKFIRFDEDELAGAGLHSNNIHLLKQSRCFQASDTMTCSTCHDSHRNQRGDLRGYSQSCLQCHQKEDCPQETRLGANIADNCIDCHMPKQPDDRFAYDIDGKTYKFDLRTHLIKPYPQPAGDSR